jgi:hypothetical protein
MKSLVMFSVNDYDSDGDIRDRGIFLNFGDTRIKVADNIESFKVFSERINGMIEEIVENYDF